MFTFIRHASGAGQSRHRDVAGYAKTRKQPRTMLALTLLAGCAISGAAQAALMTVTVTGSIYSGFDAYRNSVYFGPNTTNNLAGMTASISITYDTALMVNQAGGSYYSFWHQPAYPYFLGSVGSNPVRSASFTVNGVTLDLDVSGLGEVGKIDVDDRNLGSQDSYTLRGGDTRTTWCANDSQCAEGVSIGAGGPSTQNLFDADGFNPTDSYTWLASNGVALTGSVRLVDSILCQPAGQGGQGGAAGLCPAGRFADGATHWVDFQLNGTQLTIAPAAAVPLPAAGWFLASGLAGLAGLRRRKIGVRLLFPRFDAAVCRVGEIAV